MGVGHSNNVAVVLTTAQSCVARATTWFVITEVGCVTGVSVPDLPPPFYFLLLARQSVIPV